VPALRAALDSLAAAGGPLASLQTQGLQGGYDDGVDVGDPDTPGAFAGALNLEQVIETVALGHLVLEA
jgi:hypothetical protein